MEREIGKYAKVSEKWFKDHNWKKFVDNHIDEDGIESRHLIYELKPDGSKLHARYDRIVYVENGKTVSRFYMFFAKGCTGFEVLNRVSKNNFRVNTIISALNVVGYDEFGDWIDEEVL